MIMEDVQRFATSLTPTQRNVLLARTGLYDGIARNIGETARMRDCNMWQVQAIEARIAAKFDLHVLKPYLELQRKETDGRQDSTGDDRAARPGDAD